MAQERNAAVLPAASEEGPAADLAMPPERRQSAKAHAAVLSQTARRIAAELPLGADVDDFRRLLLAEAKP